MLIGSGFLGGRTPKSAISYTYRNDPYNSPALPCRLWKRKQRRKITYLLTYDSLGTIEWHQHLEWPWQSLLLFVVWNLEKWHVLRYIHLWIRKRRWLVILTVLSKMTDTLVAILLIPSWDEVISWPHNVKMGWRHCRCDLWSVIYDVKFIAN